MGYAEALLTFYNKRTRYPLRWSMLGLRTLCGPERRDCRRLPTGQGGMRLLADVHIARGIRVSYLIANNVVHAGFPDTHFLLVDDLDFPPERRGAVRQPIALRRVCLQASPERRIVGEHIHDRMPVILPNEAKADWLNPKYAADDLIRHATTEIQFQMA